jgi:hypothetical protein
MTFVARIIAEQDGRFPPLNVAWPPLVLDSVDERLTHEGFRQAGEEETIDELTEAWQINDLDELAPEGHYAALATGISFVMIGPSSSGTPLVTVEYPDQMVVEVDPRTRQVVAGLKLYRSDQDATTDDMASLYLPGRAIEFEVNDLEHGDETPYGEWGGVIADDPRLPSVPIVPLLNRPRRGEGRSELVELKPVVDAANQTATNMMAAIEHHAVPRKWLLGAGENDFVDESGKKVPLWKVATGDVWAVPFPEQQHKGEQMPNMQIGQFSASDLRNFHESIKMLATLAASFYGLPPNYMGYTSDNPVSAEAIRYSLDRLVKRAERRQVTFGGTWERAMRIVWAMLGNDPADVSRLESVWRDPSTPTRASMADAAQKLVSQDIIDREQAWIDIGYSEQTKKAMRTRFARVGGQSAANLAAIDQIPTTLPTAPTLPPAFEVDGVAPALRS